ncbi:XK-related 4 [Pelobates cultripes]|uniref:XK-related protein n=1 Tax=Pelobates cultripes TaxID=61616 RepID=A0AAD1S094_PELCU|nr:XK-related 4 [Pelobates cultripes]
MAAKSDGMLKMKKGDVAFTPLQDSEHSGSVQGLAGGSQPGAGGSRCCCSGGEPGTQPWPQPRPRRCSRYSVWDCLWIVAAAAVYLADVGSDVWLSVDYYVRGQRWWFGLTLFFAVLGSLSVQLFSFRWFVHDFSTESSAPGSAPPGEGKPGSAVVVVVAGGEGRASTPQRQASTASSGKTNATSATNATATTPGNGRASAPRTASCSFCIWTMQSLIHILQLGQIWR